jgi:hypothetical protein
MVLDPWQSVESGEFLEAPGSTGPAVIRCLLDARLTRPP